LIKEPKNKDNMVHNQPWVDIIPLCLASFFIPPIQTHIFTSFFVFKELIGQNLPSFFYIFSTIFNNFCQMLVRNLNTKTLLKIVPCFFLSTSSRRIYNISKRLFYFFYLFYYLFRPKTNKARASGADKQVILKNFTIFLE